MLFFGSFLALAAAVVAIPAPEIVKNSERLARNLPPLPPKFGRTLPGHARDSPTPAYVARSTASETPVSYQGRIEVRNAHGGSKIGYLENTKGGFGGVNFSHDEEALYVSFKTTSSGTGPFDILATKPKFKAPYYLGAASSKHSPTLSAHSAETVGFVNVEKTPRHSSPVKVTGGLGESAIWSIHPSTKEITAHWVNSDGSKAPTVIAYDTHENGIFFVGDLEAYNKANTTPASAVKFYLA